MFTRRSFLSAVIGYQFKWLANAKPAIPSGKRVIVITAPWCAACKVLKAVVDDLSRWGWSVGLPHDRNPSKIIICDPETPAGWEICKVLDVIGTDGNTQIPRIHVVNDGVRVGNIGAIYKSLPKSPWKMVGDDRDLTPNNLADWINEQWKRPAERSVLRNVSK